MHNGKSSQAFRTISEAATEVGEKDHVLRFWEKEIKELNPIKNHGSRRYYRPEDIMLLHAISYFLRHGGYRIEGVKSLLSKYGVHGFLGFYENRGDHVGAFGSDNLVLSDEQVSRLRILGQDMLNFRDRLVSVLG